MPNDKTSIIEPTEEMIAAVASIVSPYAAKLIWQRWQPFVGRQTALDARRFRLLRSLKNEGFGEVLAEEAFSWQVPIALIETGDIEAILDYMLRTESGLRAIEEAEGRKDGSR